VHLDFVRTISAKEWPSETEIGPDGEGALWLVIQHADQDPSFQYKMLSLLGPAEGADWQKDRAYLYDRVMKNISGKQRYGTQLICANGHYELSPLEEERSQLDMYRKSVGMIPFAEYLKHFPSACSPSP
jgi:hypothetical protein